MLEISLVVVDVKLLVGALVGAWGGKSSWMEVSDAGLLLSKDLICFMGVCGMGVLLLEFCFFK